MKILIPTILFTIFLSSCQPKTKFGDEVKVANTLVKALYNFDTIQIRKMIGVNPEDIGEDGELYMVKIERTNHILQETGLPDMKKYEIKEYPKESADLVDITVPLENKKEKIIVRFVKFLPVGKVAYFQLDGPILESEGTISPE